ncbi:HINT domain-containing protein [Micromonospora sp. NBC_00389]|uniref:polymorphic toxin-type HINT domain-containing protein n=1 Tax=Micromonospora sp. NBC_00389 TaxID=2903586 RepID=UPI002E21F483
MEDTTPADGTDDSTVTVLYTTQHHPFWDQTNQQWVDAANLTVGHQLRTTDGDTVTVTAVRNHTGAQNMRDLTVADIHTYYVIAGNTPVLVHNCDPVANKHPDELPIELMEADFQGIKPASAGSGEFAAAMGQDGTYLWALGESGNLGIVPAANKIHHTVITGGDAVLGAGQLTIRNGQVTSFDNFTGHYTPTCACAKTFLQRGSDAFMAAGIHIPFRVWRDFGGVG